MGEGRAIVIINNTDCYLIESGHNNEGYSVIKMAVEKHQKKIAENNNYYREHNIIDNDNGIVYISPDISDVKVYWLSE